MRKFSSLTLVALLLVAGLSPAQQRDKIYYRDRTAKPEKSDVFEGTIVEETVNGVKVKPQVGPDRTFPVMDIIDVAYAVPSALQIPYQPILNAESALRTGAADKARMTQLIKEYTTFLTNLKDPKAVGLRRHINYRLAILKAEVAEKREDQLDAIKQLDQTRKEVNSSWQLIPLTRRLVQLMASVGKIDDAAKVVADTAKTPNLAKELKQEMELALIDLSIQAGKVAEVESRINEALTLLPANDPMAARLKVYQVGVQAAKGGNTEALVTQLKTMIEQAQDPGLKALAYNTLGDCYASKGLKKDAMWSYLWVDVVYNQDKVEHTKAVERLARVFQDLNDDVRAERYKEKLKSMR